MGSIPLHYIDLRTFCYATEDEQRVVAALQTLLPEDAAIERAETTGHFGDRILVLSARLETADDVRHVLRQLATVDEIDQLIAELDERVTENCELFLRLDKQAAFGTTVELGTGITVRAKVEAYPAKRELAIENARDVLTDIASE
ncbi:MAG: RNA-binding protein [Natrialbaceae archaeon]|nr:RNA-binding protein [Natrialbaceae archaeon]